MFRWDLLRSSPKTHCIVDCCFMLLSRNYMNLSKRSYVNNPDVFCYIYGEYAFKENRKTVSDFIKRAYKRNFGVRLCDRDEIWAPHQD